MLALAIAGSAFALVHAIHLLRIAINTEQFVLMLAKLLGAGNLDRAVKLCRAASIAPLGRVAEAIVSAGTAPGRHDDDPVSLRRALDSASRVRMAEEEAKLRRWVPVEFVAGVLLAVPVALSIVATTRPSPAAAITTGAGWFLLLGAIRKRRKTMRDLAHAAEQLVDATTAAATATAVTATTSSA